MSLESSLTPSRPALLADDGFELVRGVIGSSACFGDLAQDEKQHAGIDVAGARAADDAAGGRQPHGRIEALAIANRGDRRAVAEVRDDQLLGNFGCNW